MQFHKRAEELFEEMVAHRRYLHEHAEVGENLPLTTEYIMQTLKSYGYDPQEICQSGVTATVGKPGKTVLLRAETDALPMTEESGLPFSSCDPEAAHTCGHDLHAAALLGVAKMLKEHEQELAGTVKFMFQPAEEIFKGADKMIQAGILENPRPDIAFSGHVTPRYPVGTIAFREGAAMASCYGFRITITGKAAHGANPDEGVDPINIAAHIYLALQELIAREVSFQNGAVLTIGSFHAGSMANSIPQTAELMGTMRSFDNEVRKKLIRRIECVTQKTAEMFCGTAELEVLSNVPVEYNDPGLSADLHRVIPDVFGHDAIEDVLMTGSDDFAYVTEQIPSALVFIGARDPLHEGPFFPGHHPKVLFDENVLKISSTLYAELATRWLAENN